MHAIIRPLCCVFVFAGAIAAMRAAGPDYAEPPVLTGTVVARGTTNVLFLFKRTATRTGATVHVLREFTTPGGQPAAREQCTYVDGQLSSFELENLQINAHGSTKVSPDPRNPKKRKLIYEYSVGKSKKKSADETIEGAALVPDMISYFIAQHWDELMRGQAASFRFIAQERLETVGFKLVKESETVWKGKPVVRLRMEPTSFIIAAIVDPLFFVVEKEGGHRVVQYDGRTTPKLLQNGSWKDLDAVSLYDWNR